MHCRSKGVLLLLLPLLFFASAGALKSTESKKNFFRRVKGLYTGETLVSNSERTEENIHFYGIFVQSGTFHKTSSSGTFSPLEDSAHLVFPLESGKKCALIPKATPLDAKNNNNGVRQSWICQPRSSCRKRNKLYVVVRKKQDQKTTLFKLELFDFLKPQDTVMTLCGGPDVEVYRHSKTEIIFYDKSKSEPKTGDYYAMKFLRFGEEADVTQKALACLGFIKLPNNAAGDVLQEDGLFQQTNLLNREIRKKLNDEVKVVDIRVEREEGPNPRFQIFKIPVPVAIWQPHIVLLATFVGESRLVRFKIVEYDKYKMEIDRSTALELKCEKRSQPLQAFLKKVGPGENTRTGTTILVSKNIKDGDQPGVVVLPWPVDPEESPMAKVDLEGFKFTVMSICNDLFEKSPGESVV